MKFLKEALKDVRRLDDEPDANDNESLDDLDLDGAESTGDDQPDDELNLDVDSEEGTDEPIDGIANQAVEDPNKRGLIRTVKKAHLVYKRETEDGSFEELWVINVGGMKDELKIRKAILAGTDIPTNNIKSPDGKQSYTVWTSGNVEMVHIVGMPS